MSQYKYFEIVWNNFNRNVSYLIISRMGSRMNGSKIRKALSIFSSLRLRIVFVWNWTYAVNQLKIYIHTWSITLTEGIKMTGDFAFYKQFLASTFHLDLRHSGQIWNSLHFNCRCLTIRIFQFAQIVNFWLRGRCHDVVWRQGHDAEVVVVREPEGGWRSKCDRFLPERIFRQSRYEPILVRNAVHLGSHHTNRWRRETWKIWVGACCGRQALVGVLVLPSAQHWSLLVSLARFADVVLR